MVFGVVVFVQNLWVVWGGRKYENDENEGKKLKELETRRHFFIVDTFSIGIPENVDVPPHYSGILATPLLRTNLNLSDITLIIIARNWTDASKDGQAKRSKLLCSNMHGNSLHWILTWARKLPDRNVPSRFEYYSRTTRANSDTKFAFLNKMFVWIYLRRFFFLTKYLKMKRGTRQNHLIWTPSVQLGSAYCADYAVKAAHEYRRWPVGLINLSAQTNVLLEFGLAD